MELSQNFVNALVRQMERKGYNANQLSIAAGINRSTLSRILHGKADVSLETVEKISKALDLKPSSLLEFTA